MTRAGSSMVLLGICVCAVLIGALRLATEQTPLPTGSSYSTQPDGAMGLFDWLESTGARPSHLRDASIDPDASALLVLQPEVPPDSLTQGAFDKIPSRGGTLIVAGDSVSWLLYARTLGVTIEPVPYDVSTATSRGGLSIPFGGRYRLSAKDAQSLLVLQDGTTVGIRFPYQRGTAIVIASSDVFTNRGLHNDNVARFIFREVLPELAGRGVAFDEIHHSFTPVGSSPQTVNTLLFGTAPGHAVVYAAVLLFLFLLLGGWRLGPALSGADPTATQRTMYEHIQMLAGLYRRAGQFRVVRDYFVERYTRRQHWTSAEAASAVARVQSARSELELIAAIAGIDDAV